MKNIFVTLMLLMCTFVGAMAQETVLWEGTPANVLDARYSLGTPFKNAGLQVGDVLRVYLTNMTEDQKVWIKIDGGSVNSPDLFEAGTKYFDHTLTADNIAKIENASSTNTSYNQGGLYIKFAAASGKVYKVTVRRKATPKNQFGLYLGDPVQDNVAFTQNNNLLTLLAAEPALNDTIVMQFSGATAGDKMWVQNSSWGGSYGFTDLLDVKGDGTGEFRVVLTQAAANDFAETGCILHRSTVDYSIGKVYLHKYVKPENVVLPPSTDIILWSGSVSAGTVDLRYNAARTAVDNANISAKDTIKIYMKGVDAGDQVILKETQSWDGIYCDLTAGQNVAEYVITTAYAEKIRNASFVVQRPNDTHDFTILNVTVAKYVPKPLPGYEVLVNEDTYIQWDSYIYDVPASKLENLAVGDKIHVFVKQFYADGNKTETESSSAARISFQNNSGYRQYITPNTTYTFPGGSKHYILEVDQSVYDKMHNPETNDVYGLRVSGYYYTFSKVLLEHPTRFTEVTMSANGLATFSHDTEAVDFEMVDGLNAYTASISGDQIVTELVTEAIPANEGLILQGTKNATYRIPFASEARTVSGNILLPTDGSAVNGYVLGSTAAYGVGFYKVSAKVVDAGKAYIPASISGATRISIDFMGEATGIDELTPPQVDATATRTYYNLMGQRVMNKAKGVVIVNGKKTLNK